MQTPYNMPNTLPDRLPNHRPDIATWQYHILELPQCCPASKNPQPGSTIEISYKPINWHLEVYALKRYIDRFQGGLKCPHSGAMIIRDQEQMIQQVAEHCSDLAETKVIVTACLILDAGKMIVKCVKHYDRTQEGL